VAIDRGPVGAMDDAGCSGGQAGKSAFLLDVFDSRGVRCASSLATKRETTVKGVEIKSADLMMNRDGPHFGYN
jgi:hypothetical protein